jgi:predicted MFS family arabinose efflux permease
MVYPFLVVVGIGWVFDMTGRRAMVYDLVGPGRIDNAMGLESVSMAMGLALGTLVGGTTVEAVGVGAAFLGVAGMLTVSFVLLLSVPRRALKTRSSAASSGDSPIVALREGLGLLRSHRALVSVLGVTAFVNFFYFSFTPLVQVIGKDLGVGAALIGLLASMTGFGMMAGSMYIARYRPVRRGLAYVAGSFVAMALLVSFAVSPWYGFSLVALLVSSVGTGLFGSTQATLVMTSVPEAVRGRALGLLATAIGMLPLGMLALGELAQRVGARTAIVIATLVGLGFMIVWQIWRPEARRLRA